ncbi:MAG: hypothetical protein AAGI11_06010 [Pseudomonadota bacterium]
MGRAYRLVRIACLLAFTTVSALADGRPALNRQGADFLAHLRMHSPQAAELLDRAAAVLVFPDMVAMGFGEGGRYGEGSLWVGGEPRSYYVTAGGPDGPAAELLVFLSDTALADLNGGRSWRVLAEPPPEDVVRLGWDNGRLQVGLPLAGSRFVRLER